MKILPHLLHQMALYWSPAPLSDDGTRDYDSVTPVAIKCHWVARFNENVNEEGEQYLATAEVDTDHPIERRGMLFLTTASDQTTALTQIPSTLPEENIIQNVHRLPSVSIDETLYRAIL